MSRKMSYFPQKSLNDTQCLTKIIINIKLIMTSYVQNSHSAVIYFISTLYFVIFLYTQYRSELTLKLAFNSVILHAPFKNLDLQIVWLTILLSSNAFDIRICSKGPPNQNINYLVRQIIISYSQLLFAKLIYEKKIDVWSP